MMVSRFNDDHRLAEAKARDIGEVADALGIMGLVRMGVERVGPCPQCGGRDRFGVNTRKGAFLCRRCDAKGGVVDLVMFVRGCAFPEALDWLCGPRQDLSADERAERERRAAENKRAQDARAQKERERAIQRGRRIWEEGRPAEGTPVREYLARRGISAALLAKLPICLRFHPDLPFMVEIDGTWREVHRGPAMLAAVQGPDDRFRAVHRTWLDLSRAKGKAKILHPVTGEELPAKKVEGSKKGGAIRLSGSTPREVMVMGEGIETTLSAQIAWQPGAAFWAGVDLGNMSGQRRLGKGLLHAGIPDLDDRDAFLPPPWVKRLIYVQDGDSEPKTTRAKLLAGLRRAMVLRPGLTAQIVHAGEGVDLNDVLMGQGDG